MDSYRGTTTGLWGLKSGETRLRILSEVEPTDDCPDNAAMHWYERYFDEDRKRYVILAENEEPANGEKRQGSLVVAAFDRTERGDDDRVKYFNLPGGLLATMSKQTQMVGTICDCDVIIDKTGSQLNTRYTMTFTRDQSKVRNLAAIRAGIDIDQALMEEKKRLDEAPDREPEKKSLKELRALSDGELVKYARSLDIPTNRRKREDVYDDIMEAQD
jgi:hypothetical protein